MELYEYCDDNAVPPRTRKNPHKPPDFFTAGIWKRTFSKWCFQDVFLRIKHSGWQNQDASFRMKDSGCVFQNGTFRKFHLSPDFLCFAENYACVADFVPHDYAILDFGSYMMAQSYFFKDFTGGYWGIDNYRKSELFHDLKPFLLEGCKNKAVPMVSTSIQEAVGILKNTIPKDLNVYAICSGVPDKEAVEEVRRNFPNHAIMYPGEESDFSVIFAEEIAKRREGYVEIVKKDEELHRITRSGF